MKLFFIFVIWNVLVLQANATPWGMPGDAVVRSENGRLSICLPEKISRDVGFVSISVSEESLRNGRRSTMWDIEKEQNSPPILLKAGDCFFYGMSLAGYQQRVTATPLVAGQSYHARINVDVQNPTRQSIFSYVSVFCVSKQGDGSFDYLQYHYDSNGKSKIIHCESVRTGE